MLAASTFPWLYCIKIITMKIARGCTFVLNNLNYSYLNAPLSYSTTLNSFYAVFFLYCLLIITVQLYFVNVYCTYLLTEWLYTQWVSHGRVRNHLNSNKQHSEDAMCRQKTMSFYCYSAVVILKGHISLQSCTSRHFCLLGWKQWPTGMTGHESCDDNGACDPVEVENLLQSA